LAEQNRERIDVFFGIRAGLCQASRVALSKEFPSNVALLVLRAVAGVNMAWLHGWDKLYHFSSKAGGFPDPLGMGSKYSLVVAIVGEFAGAILMAAGFLGRLGAFLLSFAAGLTLFSFLRSSPWHEREPWALYFAASLAILLLGCGRYSLDTFVWKRLGKGGGKAPSAPAGK